MGSAVRRRTGPRLTGIAVPAACVLLLVAVSYAWLGYRYQVSPQGGILAYVLRFDGRLAADWSTDLPPAHWAFTHALGALPPSLLRTAFWVLWLGTMGLLWTAWVMLARTLAVPVATSLAAGLLLLPGQLDGIGATPTLPPYLYPTNTALALILLAVAALVRERLRWCALLTGLAALVHPGVGILGILVSAPVLGWQARRRPRELGVLAALMALPAAPSLIQAATSQAGGSGLPADRRFDLLVTVRIPYHMLFSKFPTSEWIAFAAACLLLALGAIRLRRLPQVRMLAAIAALIAVLLVAGGIASVAGGPLALAQLQTARVSPVLVVFGVLLTAAWLTRAAGPWATVILLGAFAIGTGLRTEVRDQVAAHAASAVPWVTSASLELTVLLPACLAVAVFARRPPRLAAGRAVAVAAAAVVAVVTLALTVDRAATRRSGVDDPPLHAIAGRAHALTHPSDVILVPPAAENFPVFARRAAVVTFGAGYRFGKGDVEWVHRIEAITGDPHVLDVEPFGADVVGRVRAMTADYERNVRRDRDVLCRYRVRMVVSGNAGALPAWLEPVFRSGGYELSRVAPGTCR